MNMYLYTIEGYNINEFDAKEDVIRLHVIAQDSLQAAKKAPVLAERMNYAIVEIEELKTLPTRSQRGKILD